MKKKTYHSAKTGKFVSKEFMKNNPDTTVVVTSSDLKQEIIDFLIFLTKHNGSIDVGNFDCTEDAIDEYLEDN